MRFSEIPSAQEIQTLLEKAQQEGLDASIIERLKVILHFAQNRQSVSATCRHFGISRSTFHRWMERFDPTDVRSLQDRSREAVYVQQTTLASEIIEIIRRYRLRYPHMGKEKISDLLRAEHGVEVSPSAIGRIIERECFYFADTPLHWKKRMAFNLETGQQVSGDSTAGDSAEQGQRLSAGAEHPVDIDIAPSGARLLWRHIRRLLLVSSIITNVAFLAMLLSMSLWERAEKAKEQRILALPPAIESTEQPIHAAPPLRPASAEASAGRQGFEGQASYAPMP